MWADPAYGPVIDERSDVMCSSSRHDGETVPDMRCLTCEYPLHSLGSNRCPECGRPFDPDDASTFADSPFPLVVRWASGWIPWFRLSLVVVMVLNVVVAAIVFHPAALVVVLLLGVALGAVEVKRWHDGKLKP